MTADHSKLSLSTSYLVVC